MSEVTKIPFLSCKEISERISQLLIKYDDLSFLEQYAMYMGKAQILEFGLKKLLESKFGHNLEDIEKWTLGKIRIELEKCNLREDFFILLREVVDSRNYLAHDLLADETLLKSTLSELQIKGQFTKNHRILWKAIYELEQLILLFDWTNENNGWK